MALLSLACLLTLFVFTNAAVGECDLSELGYECKKSLAEYYNIHWTLRGEVLHMALEGLGAEWVGFSFPKVAEQMAPAEAVIGYVDINGPSVAPYYLITQSVYAEDEDFVVTLSNVSAIQDTERTIVAFTRSIKQGRYKIDVDVDMPINFAIGDVDYLRYHREKGSTTIRLAAEPDESRTAAFRPPSLTETLSPDPDDTDSSAKPSLPPASRPDAFFTQPLAVASAIASEPMNEAFESVGGEDDDDEIRLMLEDFK